MRSVKGVRPKMLMSHRRYSFTEHEYLRDKHLPRRRSHTTEGSHMRRMTAFGADDRLRESRHSEVQWARGDMGRARGLKATAHPKGARDWKCFGKPSVPRPCRPL